MIENDKVAYQNHHRFSRAVKKIVAMYRDLEVGGSNWDLLSDTV